MLTVTAVQRTSGVLYIAIMNSYDVSREAAAWPFFLRKTIGMFAATLIGIIASEFPIRCQMFIGLISAVIGMGSLFFVDDILYITLLFGILYGFGSGVVGMCNMINVNKFFSRYRTVALGITLAGISAGAFALPPLLEFSINKYGLRGSYLILTGIILEGFIAAVLYRDPPRPKKPKVEKKDRRTSSIASIAEVVHRRSIETAMTMFETETPTRKESISLQMEPPNLQNDSTQNEDFQNNFCLNFLKSLLYIFKSPMFHVIWLSFMIYDFAFQTFLTVIVDHGIDCGIDGHKAVFFLSASSIAELFGRLGGGWIVDLQFIKRKNAIRFGFSFMAGIFIGIPFLKNYIVLLFLTAVIGLIGSFININATAVYVDYLGIDYLPLALGTGATFTGLLSLVTPRIIGYIRDSSGSYSLLFFSFGGLLGISALCWIMEPLLNKFRPRRPTFKRSESLGT
ncbi:monocarboxylate transporter 7-like [Centruroides sculpturatus]|uniref:monocarboxylate transporter 7-like n=1 Tax=Centruroides sculpturatus TaxID=218467 RepID=UPI000C6DD476|nr:monocarboxylate transporter 7-like [Centruroides sculpturatus]